LTAHPAVASLLSQASLDAHGGLDFRSVIQKDQVDDYAACKGMSLEQADRWLPLVLGYDP
jgi:hypothetical protein